MFESKINYPCAVTSSDDDGLVAGIRWWRSKADSTNVTLWVPLRQTLRNNQRLERLAGLPSVRVVTGRGMSFVSGSVLAAYPRMADIGEIQRSAARMTAFCVVAWDTDEIAPWVAATKPEILGDASEWDGLQDDLGIHPVVLEAMDSVTRSMNHNNTISAGYEKDAVVSALLALHDARYELDPEALEGWALAHGWRGRNPEQLATYVRSINRGSRPRARRTLRADYVRILEQRVAGE